MSKTPSPDTPEAKETREDIAARIATRAVGRNPNCATRRQLCADAILSALRNEREACARVAEDSGTVFYAERQKKHSPYDPKDLVAAQDICDKVAAAIREGK